MPQNGQKLFSTVDDQVVLLRDTKGIQISNEIYAKDILSRIGYFPLMGGYKHLFRIPLTKNYKPGTSFEEIVALYEFDADLRELVFRYLLQIERHVRSLISYYFTELHGESQSEYLNPNNYNNIRRNRRSLSKLIATLQYATGTSDYAYINYYRNRYGNIPLWVLVNTPTFGNISKMFQLSQQTIQSKICRDFGTVNSHQMEQMLSVLTKFRNVCAHGERLFTFKTVDTLTNMPLHAKLGIPMNGTQYVYGKNDLFAVVIALRYLLPRNDFAIFKRKLSLLIKKANRSIDHISEVELLKHMGFPQNWKDISRYRI